MVERVAAFMLVMTATVIVYPIHEEIQTGKTRHHVFSVRGLRFWGKSLDHKNYQVLQAPVKVTSPAWSSPKRCRCEVSKSMPSHPMTCCAYFTRGLYQQREGIWLGFLVVRYEQLFVLDGGAAAVAAVNDDDAADDGHHHRRSRHHQQQHHIHHRLHHNRLNHYHQHPDE